MLTDKEILLACEMRLKGKTWEEVGAAIGVTFPCIHGAIRERIFYRHNGTAKSSHPYVYEWMRSHAITARMIAAESGLSMTAIYENLHRATMNLQMAETICRMSGLTMDQVQALEKED